MPRITLWTEQDDPPVQISFRHADGTVGTLSNDRLWCQVFVGSDPVNYRAVVDIGAPSTLFPLRVWRRFAAQIAWLDFASGPSMRRGALAGTNYHFRLGRVPVRLAGRDAEPILPAVEIIAQFEQVDPMQTDAERLTYPVVGMQFGPLEGRYLVVGPRRPHPERCEAWITDERPVDPLVLTSATL